MRTRPFTGTLLTLEMLSGLRPMAPEREAIVNSEIKRNKRRRKFKYE